MGSRVRLNRRKILRVLAGILFALATIKIHYDVKVEMERGGRGDGGQLENLQVGSESPDFSATDLQGRQVTLSEFRGQKVVVVDFWATWCAPCVMAMPKLQELHDEFKEREVEVLAVNLGEDPDLVRRFLELKKYTFRVVMDQKRVIANRFGVSAIPALVVVDADGRIGWTRVGYNPEKADELRQVVERLSRERRSQESGAKQKIIDEHHPD